MELGYSDLLSLEPTDKLNRPLRLKEKVRKEVKKKQIEDLSKLKNINLVKSPADKHSEKTAGKVKEVFKEISTWKEDELWKELAKKQI